MAKRETMKLTELVPCEYNPRTISEQNLNFLCASIGKHSRAIPGLNKKDGYRLVSTITVNKNGNRIIGGHQRVVALQSLNEAKIYLDDITFVDLEPGGLREKALNVALNLSDVQGDFDWKLLGEIIHEFDTGESFLDEKKSQSGVMLQDPARSEFLSMCNT